VRTAYPTVIRESEEERAALEQRLRGRPAAAARAGLEAEVRAGRIATPEDARRYLAEHRGLQYASLNGGWWQPRKHRIKPQTGRRRHRRADAAAREAFTREVRGRA
jgi:hypothetical protein